MKYLTVHMTYKLQRLRTIFTQLLLLIVLGYSGYGQQPWLLVPFRTPENGSEEAYNAAHRKARHPVERCIGVWKARFRCLCKQRVLLYSPVKAGRIINACAVLHNILINSNYPLPPEEDIAEQMNDPELEPFVMLDEQAIINAGKQVRDRVVRAFF